MDTDDRLSLRTAGFAVAAVGVVMLRFLGPVGAAVILGAAVVAYASDVKRWYRWVRATRAERGSWYGTLEAWREEPRPPLTQALRTNVFLAFAVPLVLFWWGAIVLFGPHETFRLGGVLSICAGVGVVAMIGAYVGRPADD